jgi:hypothetical protein
VGNSGSGYRVAQQPDHPTWKPDAVCGRPRVLLSNKMLVAPRDGCVSTHASDATGSIRFASCSLTEAYRLKLVRFKQQKLAKALVLTLPTFLENLENEKEWIEVPGEECTAAGECRFVMKSKIQVLHVSFRWRSVGAISGNFVTSFIDGRKLEGSFSAKGIKPMTEIICE